jgi:tetratricopeptide (TPR) repeat protein
MKKALLLIVTFLCSVIQVIMAQTPEEALKKVVRLETESYLKGDSATWKLQYVQDETTTRIYVANGFYQSNIGWKKIAPILLQWMKQRGKPSRYTDIQQTNFIIKYSDKLAWIGYDQNLRVPSTDTLPPYSSREVRTLVKDNDQWKISSIISVDTLSFSSTKPEDVENLFNAAGYNFLTAKKINEAIEVFKFNVKMYPGAWNTYDSLGEAYAASGNKKLAIENYEKSIKLNPKNDNGIAILTKLKKE